MKAIVLALLGGALVATPAFAQSDAQVRQRIVRESIAAYPGNCPCPYSRARNGSQCGGRSAWSRRGGYAPVCYAREVSAAQVREWRRSHR